MSLKTDAKIIYLRLDGLNVRTTEMVTSRTTDHIIFVGFYVFFYCGKRVRNIACAVYVNRKRRNPCFVHKISGMHTRILLFLFRSC